MDEKRLLLSMAERLYIDIKFVTEQNPTQIVDEDGARAYNSILKRTRAAFGNQLPPLADFPDWAPRNIKYKDALVAAGQIYALLRAVVEPSRVPVASQERRPGTHHPRPGTGTGASQQQSSASGRGFSLASLPSTTPLPVDPENRPATGSADTAEIPPPAEKPAPPKRNDDGTIPFTLE